MINFSF